MSRAYINRGNCYYDTGNIDLAIRDFDQALAIDPNYASAYSNRGTAYKHRGNLDRAIRDYDRSLELDPGDADTYYNRANAYRDKCDLGRAIQDYNKAIGMNKNPSVGDVYYSRGIAWLRLAEWEKARSDFADARNLGISLAKALPSVGYEDVADFEHKNAVKLPRGIASMLAD